MIAIIGVDFIPAIPRAVNFATRGITMANSNNGVNMIIALSAAFLTAGCVAAAAGVGAEAAYVSTQETRTAGETIDDQRITASVKAKLLADKDVSALAINVDTYKRKVTLKGNVSSESEAAKALDLARSVSGVIAVSSQLVVG